MSHCCNTWHTELTVYYVVLVLFYLVVSGGGGGGGGIPTPAVGQSVTRTQASMTLECRVSYLIVLDNVNSSSNTILCVLCVQVVVRETPHIRKGYMSESTEPGEGGVWRLKTDGVNLQVGGRHAPTLY